jgi:hypothetical protein
MVKIIDLRHIIKFTVMSVLIARCINAFMKASPY